jgi:hypothetical protein
VGHTRARCHDDQRTLTVSHGSSEAADRHRCIGMSRRVDDARSSNLVLCAALPVGRRSRAVLLLTRSTMPLTASGAEDQHRATSVPERAENCGRQRSSTGIANDLQPSYLEVDPLPERTFLATGHWALSGDQKAGRAGSPLSPVTAPRLLPLAAEPPAARPVTVSSAPPGPAANPDPPPGGLLPGDGAGHR